MTPDNQSANYHINEENTNISNNILISTNALQRLLLLEHFVGLHYNKVKWGLKEGSCKNTCNEYKKSLPYKDLKLGDITYIT